MSDIQSLPRSVQREGRTTVAFRTVLVSILGLWLCYFVLTTARASIAGFSLQDEMLWRRAVVVVVGIAMTLLVWLILRLFDERPLWMKISAAILVALPAAISIAQTNQWVFHDIQQRETERIGRERGFVIRRDEAGNILVDIPVDRLNLPGEEGSPPGDEEPAASVLVAPPPTAMDRWRGVIDIAIGRYFLLLAWASLYFAMLYGAQAQAAERRAARFRSAAKAAELRSLRYQVNPHFLFNSLNSLSALVMTGKEDRAESMIQALSNFYRHSLADDTTADVALEDEFDLQRHYLEIEAVRFPERLRAEFVLPDALREVRVPGMILQPLVENSVKYAVAPVNRPVTIRLEAREEGGMLVISVEDNGPGARGGAANISGGFGIGLANVRDRLQARFGSAGEIRHGPAAAGYLSEIRIPRQSV